MQAQEFQVVSLQNVELPVAIHKNRTNHDLANEMKKTQIGALEKASTRKMQDFDHLKKNTMLPTQTVLSSTAGLTKLSGIDIYNLNSNTGVG